MLRRKKAAKVEGRGVYHLIDEVDDDEVSGTEVTRLRQELEECFQRSERKFDEVAGNVAKKVTGSFPAIREPKPA